MSSIPPEARRWLLARSTDSAAVETDVSETPAGES